jgi:glucose/arabinose dehydrogenase
MPLHSSKARALISTVMARLVRAIHEHDPSRMCMDPPESLPSGGPRSGASRGPGDDGAWNWKGGDLLRRSLLIALGLVCIGAPALAQAPPPPAPVPYVEPPAGQPIETRPPEAGWQKPAFAGQTRGPFEPTHVAFEVKTVASGLQNPWGLAFLPDGRMLVTEKNGRMRLVTPDGKLSPPIGGIPAVDPRQGGGLLDVEVDPDYATNHLIYWAYSEPRGNGAGTTVARAKLVIRPGPDPRLEAVSQKGAALVGDAGEKVTVQNVQVLFRMLPTEDSYRSFGSRIAFGRGQTLFITLGDLDFDPYRPLVQRLDTDIGKVVRINRDGSIPRDNPFLHVKGARPEIWAVGFRNALGGAVDPKTGDLWTDENGPRGGDELNHVRGGKNYGWPVITYGEEYSGQKVGEGLTQKAGMEQPVYYWDPVIAPSGLMIYSGDVFPTWKGSIFIGSLRQRRLVRVSVKDDRVTGEEHLLTDLNERIRDVKQGPDGAIYLLTDAERGRVLKLVPK